MNIGRRQRPPLQSEEPELPSRHEISDSAFPQEGVTVQGSGIPVTIQDIINTNGQRTPLRDTFPARLAFILVYPGRRWRYNGHAEPG